MVPLPLVLEVTVLLLLLLLTLVLLRHDRVYILECSLRGCNHGQGVGFVINEVLVDTKLLARFGYQLAAGTILVAPWLLSVATSTVQSMGAAADASGGGLPLCGLSELQLSTARALLANASCSFDAANATALLQSILK